MTLLKKAHFVCLDCEATGLDPYNDRILEIGIAVFNLDEISETFESLVQPDIPIPENSVKIHHIEPSMVEGKPRIGELLETIFKLSDKNILVGHGIKYDIDLINAEAQRCGFTERLNINRSIDTLRLARLYGQSPVNSLSALRQHFNIASEGAHRAMGDVLMNIEVFKHLIKNFKTTEEVFERLAKPIEMKLMPLGKHKGRPLKDLPLDYLQWALKKDFDGDLMFSIKQELRRRKQGGTFAQATNPFGSLTL